MATVEERVGIVEGAIVRIEGRLNALATKEDVDKNQEAVIAAIAKANKDQMEILKEMKGLGRSPNY